MILTRTHCPNGLACLLFLFSLSQWETSDLHGQDATRFHVVRYIEVETDAVDDFRDAVEEKTKKFNSSEESSRWWTYRISGGKRSGQFARGFGNVTAKQLDQPRFPVQGLAPEMDEEGKYWMDNIASFEKSAGHREVWREIKGTRYEGLPEGHHPKFVKHMRWKMLPGMYQETEQHYRMFSEAIRTSGMKVNWNITRLEMGGDFMTYQMSLSFDRLDDTFKDGEVLAKAYETAHGKGSWKKHLAQGATLMQPNAEVISELWILQPKLGNSSFGR